MINPFSVSTLKYIFYLVSQSLISVWFDRFSVNKPGRQGTRPIFKS